MREFQLTDLPEWIQALYADAALNKGVEEATYYAVEIARRMSRGQSHDCDEFRALVSIAKR